MSLIRGCKQAWVVFLCVSGCFGWLGCLSFVMVLCRIEIRLIRRRACGLWYKTTPRSPTVNIETFNPGLGCFVHRDLRRDKFDFHVLFIQLVAFKRHYNQDFQL